jgi:transposase
MISTDLTDSQWEQIKCLIPQIDRKRKHDLREIFNALFYLVKTGSQWRMLPEKYPNWQLVYFYFRKWNDEEIIDHILHMLRESVRKRRGRNPQPSAGIIDSQSVRSCNNVALKSFDGGKKVKGRKRHIVVDTQGFLLSVLVTVAHLHDSSVAELLFRRLKENMCGIKIIFADGGYRGDLIERTKEKFNFLIQIVMRSDKNDGFSVIPRRWVVERTFSWFDNDRRLCRDYETLMESTEAMIKLSAIKLLVRKF